MARLDQPAFLLFTEPRFPVSQKCAQFAAVNTSVKFALHGHSLYTRATTRYRAVSGIFIAFERMWVDDCVKIRMTTQSSTPTRDRVFGSQER
jgi:hypothetical protein